MRKFLLAFCLLSSLIVQAQSYKSLPGRVEAEDYKSMFSVGVESTGDVGGGSNVGWIQDSSWMKYDVNVTVAGYYTFRFRTANGYSPEASLSLRLANGNKLGQLVLPQTGGMQAYRTVTFVAFLPQGNQTVQVFAEKGGFNFNWFEAAASTVISGKVEAENFDAMNDVRTETTSDSSGNMHVASIDDGDWMDYNVKLATGGSFSMNFRVANSYGSGVIKIKNAAGTTLAQVNVPQTGGWQSWETISTPITLPAGSQVIRIFAQTGAFNLNWFELAAPVQPVTSSVTLPAKIQAENYNAMFNVGKETTTDTDGGQNVGWIQDDSWMEYNVNAVEQGVYTISYRVANGYSPEASFALKKGDGTELGRLTVPQTGGMQGWRTINMLASLPAGEQTLKVQSLKTGWNFNWFDVKASRPLLGRMEAESFDISSDIRVESTTDTDGVSTVSYIDDADWLDYNVKIATAGTYTFGFRVANSYGNGNIQIKNGAGTILGQVNIPQTGGWNNYTTVRTTATLAAGSQVIRIYANRGAFNFNWFEIISGTVQDLSTITFNELSDKRLSEGTFNLVASSNNNETPITFTSSNTAVATVSNATGMWKVTLVGAGQTTITASQTGNTHFLPAENVARTLTITQPAADPIAGAKITLDPKRWYQLTNAANGLEGLFDGNTETDVHTGWGKIINYYEAYYPLQNGEQLTLESIRFFDYTGSTEDQPMTLSIINDQWERIPVATFTGSIYNGWVGPYPDRASNNKFSLDAPISNIRYLILTIPNTLPTEIEFYGSYTPAAPATAPGRTKNIRLKDMLGVNGYEWNFQDGANTELLVEAKVNAAKSFSGFRHYMDWEKLESREGVFSYNPTLSGSWNYDLIYQRLKQENIEVLACLKTLPGWMLASYPEAERDAENVPVRYGKDFKDPLSYLEQAKVAFQYVARYGANMNINPALLKVDTIPRWNNDHPNTIKIGLNLIKYIECDNERDKWWKGRKGYQTAREYAANMSAFYDGHKNTMGPAVGVKNADPTMKVVIAGLVTGPDFLKGMVDWCKEFRGYRADGSVNLCWDIVNFHLYTDDASSNQSGTSTRGVAPETGNAYVTLDNFVKTSKEVSQEMPVWITEAGYDLAQTSPLKAIPIGSKSPMITQADWILRTSLFSARHGIEKIFYYQLYDDNPGWPWMFGTSGLLNDNFSRRPAADYFIQTKTLFGDYVYKETIHADPVVDRYELNGKSLFILAVPDEVGRTAEYTVNLGGTGVAKIYTPTAGTNTMALLQKPIVDGKVTVTVTETPIFVISSTAANGRTTAELLSEDVSNTAVNVFPNPTTDFVNIEFTNNNSADVELKVFDARSGMLYKNNLLQKSGNKVSHKLNLTQLPLGSYIIEVKQGTTSTFHKIIKAH